MGFSGAKIAPCPPYTPLGTIESSKGLRPSRALRGFFDSLKSQNSLRFFYRRCRFPLWKRSRGGFSEKSPSRALPKSTLIHTTTMWKSCNSPNDRALLPPHTRTASLQNQCLLSGVFKSREVPSTPHSRKCPLAAPHLFPVGGSRRGRALPGQKSLLSNVPSSKISRRNASSV